MADNDNLIKWHRMDEIATLKLTSLTLTPEMVFTLPVESAPSNLQQMPGVASYYISNYVKQDAIKEGLTVGGELVIARTESVLGKAYNFVFASSNDGNVYFAGPFKNFGNHHFDKNKSVPIESLFGHTPFSKSGNES